jgi:predicted aldo/keto reductase-like oxidoreductase
MNRNDELQKSPLEACIGFIKSLPGVNHVVVGVSSLEEFKKIVNFRDKDLDFDINFYGFSIDDEQLSNPSMWRT